MEHNLEVLIEAIGLEEILQSCDIEPIDALLILHRNGYIDLSKVIENYGLLGLPTEEQEETT